ncbi:Membrane-associated protein containing RNA-binding TRAM domain and ribonuclease PIN-domain, YacL B.subtilis ortholog [hydrothermal vent metagenome]|uniref:Membrane-associated protein containing RNA-binding TRAM domain and ribonuclease PIN-domain, YacL B.subtilis ortholog n=1 Tax=hydrothermal vent metagenome TaxID=652676 RepID=A0A3B1DTH7_9ZZZZ
MLRIILIAVYILICAGAISAYVTGDVEKPSVISGNELVAFITLFLVSQIVTVLDLLIRKKQIQIISAIYFGLLVGVLLSYGFIQALHPVLPPHSLFRPIVSTLLVLMLPYLCISFLLQTKDDFRFIIPFVEFSRELKGGSPLIVDSSALIDGRMSEVVETNIFNSELLIPRYVIHEVQEVADSNDKTRRVRGRRGLEVLTKLQNNPKAQVVIVETNELNYQTDQVDSQLVELAKSRGGRLLTNDFNLNKVATAQGVLVINLNDISNALKPRHLPGDRLRIKLIKQGESHGQGVGYLDDGTMVVCENTGHMMGKEIDVIITSMLQSSSGRMIFAKQVHRTSVGNAATYK